MLNWKNTALAVLALSSSAVTAGTMGPVCTPGSVTVPCERSAWDFGGQALYFESRGDDFAGVTTVGNTATFNEFRNDWGWGFKLEGSYHFNTGNDLNVNWYHYHKTTNKNFIFTPGAAVTSLSIEPEWDAVNVELGQWVDFTEQKHIRFHGGVQFARLEREFSSRVGGVFSSSGNRKFDGFGPRVGADMTYELGNGFGVYANGAATLLVGDAKFNGRFAPAPFVFLNGKRDIVVPELEAKLGVNYAYAMPSGALILDVGYLWIDYINALHTRPITTAFNGQSDFSLDGVYFGAKWVGNFA